MYIKLFEEFGKNTEELYSDFVGWLSSKDFEFYDGQDDFRNKFFDTINSNMTSDDKVVEITDFLEEKWGLYDGYDEVMEYLTNLIN